MTWTTQDGRKIKVKDLEVPHMKNIIKRFDKTSGDVNLLTDEQLRDKVKSIIRDRQDQEERLSAAYYDYMVEDWGDRD